MRHLLTLTLASAILASCTPATPGSSTASPGASPAAQTPGTPAAPAAAKGESLTIAGQAATLDDVRIVEFLFTGFNIRTKRAADETNEGKSHVTISFEGPKAAGFKASDVKRIYPWVTTNTGGKIAHYREVGGITLPNPDVTLSFTDTTTRLAGTITFKSAKNGVPADMAAITYTFDHPLPTK